MEAGSTYKVRFGRDTGKKETVFSLSKILMFHMAYLTNIINRIPYFSQGIMKFGLSGFMILLLVSGSRVLGQVSQTFFASGSFTVPAGVTSITVECWGGGGAGGGATGNPSAGGGGAGGSYTKSILTVTPLNTYAVTVGTGGIGDNGYGDQGSSSWFGTTGTIFAEGGAGGLRSNTNNINGNAGAGSSAASIGTVIYAGGNGSNGNYTGGTPGGAGGGGAGTTGDGGNASGGTGGTGANQFGGYGANGVGNSTAGENGLIYGGGGSGGKANNSTDRSGGSGANGLVLITYAIPAGYCAGNALSVLSQTGVNSPNNSLGVPDNIFSTLNDNGDVLALTLTSGDLLTAGGSVAVLWRRNPSTGSNPQVRVDISTDGSSWTTVSTYTVTSLTAITQTIPLSINTRYIRFTETNAYDLDIDAISYFTPCTPPCVYPIRYTVTGGGSYCSGGFGFPVGLTDSESGVSYQLFLGANPVGSAVAGTGNAINFGNQLAGGTYTVVATRIVGGCSETMDGSAVITVLTVPAQPSAITGLTTPCLGSSQTYSVTNVAGVTYTWVFPAGWTQTAGGTTNSVTATVGANSGNITVTPSNTCGNGTPRTLAVTLSPAVPATPGTITGTATQCPGLTGQIYSIVAVANATTYTWTVPTGWSITAGAGTTSITVTTGTAGQNGNISVTAGNACGTSTARNLAVTVSPGAPATPGTITGTTPQCPSLTGQIYSIVAVANATTYTWTVPAGWAITAGAGTTSITVTTGTAGQNGNIGVTAGNSCGTSAAKTLAVTVNPGAPATPGTITGTIAQCPGLNGQIYSIAAVTNATTYTWTVPAGWTITAGAGTRSITVTTGAAGQNGNISVTAGNSCGTSAVKQLAVTVNPGTPATPGVISGTNPQCPSVTGQIYSIAAVPNATTYTWTVPAGWSITSGQGTVSITVTTGTSGQNGSISVFASNSCGASSSSILVVTVESLPAQTSPITPSTPEVCQNSVQNYMVNPPPPVGVTYTWVGPPGSTVLSGQGTNIIQIKYGNTSGNLTITPSNFCGNGPSQSMAISVTTSVPVQPGAMSGLVAPCTGTTQTYSVPLSGGVTYGWTVPAGWSITAGQGTNSITAVVGASAGNVQVIAGNACGGSAPRILAVTPQAAAPSQPSPITGNIQACVGSSQTYSVTNVAFVTYTWSVPAGWSINSGQGTNAINVTVGATAGNVSVVPSNECGSGPSQTLAVTVDAAVPDDPGPISGNINPCESSSQVYSVTSQVGVTYTWSVPSGSTITAGQGTNSITVTIGSTSGVVKVTYTNSCGIGPLKTLNITVSPLPASSGTITGSTLFCEGTTQTYSVINVAGVTYNWVVPFGWVINSGQGTHSITVTTGVNSGIVEVKPVNACGSGPTSILTVTVNPLPAAFVGPDIVICAGANVQIGGPAIPGNTYSWTSVPAGFISVISNPIITPDVNTIYTLVETNTATGCSNTHSVNVTANQVIDVYVTPAAQTICTGGTTSIVLSSNISYTAFSWDPVLTSGSGTSGYSAGSGALIAQTITNTSSAPSVVTYTIEATADECANYRSSVVITINPAPVVNGTAASVCSDAPSNITLGASTNGVPVATYSITNIQNNGLTASAGAPATGTGFAANVIANDAWTNLTLSPVHVIYTIVPVSALGCSGASYTVDVTVNPKPSLTNQLTKEICSGTAAGIALTSNIPATFTWTVGTITGLITGAAAGSGNTINQVLTNPGNAADGTVTYIVTPTAVTGSCPGIATNILVTVHPKPAVTNAATAAVCSGTALNIALTASAASTFTWTIGAITGSISGASPGSGSLINQVLTNPSAVAAGTVKYIITPTSEVNLCTGNPFTITVTVNPIHTVTAGASTILVCAGTPFNLTSSSTISNPVVSWTSNPAGFTSAVENPLNVNQLVTTIYTVSYTNSVTGCSNTNSVTVTAKPVPLAAIAADYCIVPGKIRLTASGGGTYLWNNGMTAQIIEVDIAGSYSVIVTGANGCTASAFMNVAHELVVNEAFTNGNVSINSDYTYYPDLPAVNNELVPDNGTNGYGVGTNGQFYHSNFWGIDHTNNASGPRNFMLVNGHGSTLTIWKQTVNVMPNTDYYFSAWAMSLNNVPPYAKLQFEVAGTPVGSVANLGAGPYNTTTANANTYWTRFYSTPKWNSGALSGPVTIRIINNENAAGGNDFGIDDISFGTLSPVPYTFNPSANSGSNSVCEGMDVQLNANIVGGMSPYYTTWTGPNGFTSSQQDPLITNIPLSGQGNYILTMHDSYGCTPQTKSVYVTVVPAPTASISGGGNCCQYGASPLVAFTGNGGAAPYTFTYNINGGPNQTTTTYGASSTAIVFAPTISLGSYVYNLVNVEDNTGCDRALNTSVTVVVQPLPVSSISGNDPVCAGSTGNIYSGNSAMTAYTWWVSGNASISGVNTNIDLDITAGNTCGNPFALTLEVTDAMGCSSLAEESFMVDDNTAPVISICPLDETITGSDVSVIVPLLYSETPVLITAAQYMSEGGVASDNCEIDTYTYSDTQSGISPIFVDRTYTLTDKCGNVTTCTQVITIIIPPDITCPGPLSVNADAGLCSAVVDPVEPTVNAGNPVTWSWVMTGATTASGTGAIGNYTFNVGVTTLTWTATNIAGSDICVQTITVIDNQPPTFSIPADLSYCVQDIFTADYWDPTIDIAPNRPEYYNFLAGNTDLDLLTSTFNDNCAAGCTFEIRWRIDFEDLTFLPALPATYITGQPSAYAANIHFPGIVTGNMVHHVTYQIVDCNGNVSASQTVNVTVKPRPNVIKLN